MITQVAYGCRSQLSHVTQALVDQVEEIHHLPQMRQLADALARTASPRSNFQLSCRLLRSCDICRT
jgi:hypothetical protein